MKQLTTTNTNKTMTSREIAEVVGKEHKNVLQDIRSLIEEGAIGELSFQPTSYLDIQNKSRPMYDLDFRATMTLITGYDSKRRSLVIDRWVKLETGEVQPDARMVQQHPKRTVRTIAQRYKAAEKALRESISTGKSLGMDKEAARDFAVRTVKESTGFDMGKLLPVPMDKRLPFPEDCFTGNTPREIQEKLMHLMLNCGKWVQDESGYIIEVSKIPLSALLVASGSGGGE